VTPLAIGVASLAAMVVLIVAGLHVAIALLLLSFLGVYLIRGNVDTAMALLAQAASDTVQSYDFGVVPLFVLMGLLVSTANLGADLFDVAHRLFRRVAGGLGIATVFANAIFAAITGISIASAAVFTKVAVPEMLRYRYTPEFATGCVAGSSVLGMLIPPSLLMIVYAFLAERSVGEMFLAGVLPGLLLATLFSAGIYAMAKLGPAYVGGAPAGAAAPPLGAAEIAVKLLPILGLVALVLGGIYGGLFTATEAGAVGALGALVIALARRRLSRAVLWEVLVETGRITVAVLFLIIAANLYSRMLALSGLPQGVVAWMASMGFGVAGFLAVYIAIVLFLGCVIDSISIMLIVLPLLLPVARDLGIDLVWFGVITVIAVEIGLLTPPFGLSVYTVRSTLADSRIGLFTIFRGTFPFVAMMFLTLLVVIAFPGVSLAFR
jgi:tripartite ATP-independent transporter DctM subunit